MRPVEGGAAAEGVAGGRPPAEAHVEPLGVQGAGSVGRAALLPLVERETQATHRDVAVAGPILVGHVEPADTHVAQVEAARHHRRRLARRRRQVHHHAAFAQQVHATAVDFEQIDAHLAAEDRPRQRDRDARGGEERVVAVAGRRQPHVVHDDAARDRVDVQARCVQIELQRRDLPNQPVTAPARRRRRLHEQRQPTHDRHEPGDRPGEPAWHPDPHVPIRWGRRVDPARAFDAAGLLKSPAEGTCAYASGSDSVSGWC